MLSVLRISGFALIDELELPLGPGLTVITGETGAGKSIVVEAMGLLRGGRAGADVIRAGSDEARVEAEGRAADDPDGDAGLLVRRVISRQGRGRVHLGGSLATAGELATHVAG